MSVFATHGLCGRTLPWMPRHIGGRAIDERNATIMRDACTAAGRMCRELCRF